MHNAHGGSEISIFNYLSTTNIEKILKQVFKAKRTTDSGDFVIGPIRICLI